VYTFMYNNQTQNKMCLVEADDKLRRLYQIKKMSKADFKKAFDNLIDVIEPYGGTVGLQWNLLIGALEDGAGKPHKNNS
jgi:hypothetical protein